MADEQKTNVFGQKMPGSHLGVDSDGVKWSESLKRVITPSHTLTHSMVSHLPQVCESHIAQVESLVSLRRNDPLMKRRV